MIAVFTSISVLNLDNKTGGATFSYRDDCRTVIGRDTFRIGGFRVGLINYYNEI